MPLPNPVRELREKVPLDSIVSSARTVWTTAPKVLDPRDNSQTRLRQFGYSLAILGVLLWATPFGWLFIALALFIIVPYLVAKSAATASSARTKAASFSRRE
jgi:hypothetical protein